MAENWSPNVNTKVLKDSASWSEPVAIIEDTTRSGKVKRRLAYSMEKRSFEVGFNFTYDEYSAFRTWFTDTILQGSLSFLFPQIDNADRALKEYRISKSGFPKYTNISGKIIKCTMVWEEV